MALSAGTPARPVRDHRRHRGGRDGRSLQSARHSARNRTVAIKILSGTLAADPQFRERFDREARTISKLDHPHICALHDVGEHEGTAYLVMQYLEGETLARRLERGAVSCREALAIAIQIADALDRAHRAGIVHRDLKPGNVMLTKSGAKLLDFGLAKTGARRLGRRLDAHDASRPDRGRCDSRHVPGTCRRSSSRESKPTHGAISSRLELSFTRWSSAAKRLAPTALRG